MAATDLSTLLFENSGSCKPELNQNGTRFSPSCATEETRMQSQKTSQYVSLRDASSRRAGHQVGKPASLAAKAQKTHTICSIGT